MIPNLTDRGEWPDDQLNQLRIAVLTEQERRNLLDTAEQQITALNTAYLRAQGILDGRPWVQPVTVGYAKGSTVTHDGRLWRSVIDGNVWEPGAPGVDERIWVDEGPADGSDPEPITAPDWAADTAYAAGDVVTYNGVLYEVLQAHTSAVDWLPDQVASLYKRL